MTTIIVSTIIACTILVLAMGIVAILLHHKTQKDILELSKWQAESSSIIDDNIPLILERFLEDCFKDLQVQYIIPKYGESGYINTDAETDIRASLVNLVSIRISDVMITKLSLYYNKDNIHDVIADKIFILVTAYVSQRDTLEPTT